MPSEITYERVKLKPIIEIDRRAWRRVRKHFRDPEIAYLNGTRPNRLPLWMLRRAFKADSKLGDRQTFGIFHEDEYIGAIELYDISKDRCTLGIIIGERDYWGKGFGSEAMIALLEYSFNELNLNQVYLRTFYDNKRAISAFHKVGFREIRRMGNGKERLKIHMKISRDNYFKYQNHKIAN